MAPLNARMDPIILLSSPPIPSLRIATPNTNATISSPPLSPLLSPSALLQELVEKGTAAKRKRGATRTPPPRQVILENISNARKNSRGLDSVITKQPLNRTGAAEPTGNPIANTSRGKRDSTAPKLTDLLVKSKVSGEVGGKGANKPKTKHTRKKGTRKDGQIVAKSTKRSMPSKSPFFVLPDAAEVPSKPVTYEKPALIPKSPNKLITEPPVPPLHRQGTPAKDTVISIDSSPAPVDIDASEGNDTKGKGTLDFADMVSEMRLSKSYSRDGSSVPSLGGLDKSGNGLVRKRAIEMVNLPSTSVASSEPKMSERKQPRKKPKTITGQATAQYREAKAAASHSLLDYFTLEDANSESAAAEKPTRKRKTTSGKKRDSVPAPILLSPKAAKRQFDETECVFGTSSQLEVMAEIEIVDKPELAEDENAPDYMPPSTSIVRRSFLKTLTKDREGGSKLMGTRRGTNIDLLDVSMVEDFEVYHEGFPAEQPKLPESRLRRGTASKLWDAAARDLDGGLLSVEVVDMSLDNDLPLLPGSPKPVQEILTTRSSELSEGPALPEHVGTVEGEPVPNLRIEGQSMGSPPSTVVHEKDIPNLRIEGQPANAPQKNGAQEEFIPNLRIEDMPAPVKVTQFAMPGTDEAKLLDHASSIALCGVSTSGIGAPASAAGTLVSSSAMAPNPGPRMQSEPSMPDYNAWITTKLKAEVAKYGFKDPKTRPRMVSVLEQCWLAKNKRNIEQEANKGTGVAASNAFVRQTRSTSPSQVNRAQSGGPNNPSHRGYSTTTAPGVSRFRENGPTIRQAPTESRDQRPPARGRKQNPPSPSSPKSPSKSVSPSRSRSHSCSPRGFRKMISRIILDIKPGSEGCKFLHAILMYDPISVEELAEWLNTQGIREGGFGTHMVTAKDVKNWCISKGVCCFSEDASRVKRKK